MGDTKNQDTLTEKPIIIIKAGDETDRRMAQALAADIRRSKENTDKGGAP